VPDVYLILSTIHIGGAEKRFVGLWKSLVEQPGPYRIFLVVTPALHQRLLEQKAFRSALETYASQVLQYSFEGSFSGFRQAIRQFIDQYTKPEDLLHFVADHPFISSRYRRNLLSVTASSLNHYNAKGRFGHFYAAFCASRVDLLDPKLTRLFRKVFFYKRGRITQTSNSYCETDQYMPGEKKDWLVFLGRFEKMKQLLPFLEALPLVHQKLAPLCGPDLHYYILGHGTQEAAAKALLASPEYAGIPVTMTFIDDPSVILNQSKVFFSLQLYNNYPSKSLLEAFSSGNIAVVTDNGNTREIALPQFSYYVPEQFSPEELASEVVKVFELSEPERISKQAAAKNFVLEQHSLDKMKAYYSGLYATILS
jgi:glycosyltransferase involved in cell wall biosynthesis